MPIGCHLGVTWGVSPGDRPPHRRPNTRRGPSIALPHAPDIPEGLLRPPLDAVLREGRRATQLRLGHGHSAPTGGLEREDNLPRRLQGRDDCRRPRERLCRCRPHEPPRRTPCGLCGTWPAPLPDVRIRTALTNAAGGPSTPFSAVAASLWYTARRSATHGGRRSPLFPASLRPFAE